MGPFNKIYTIKILFTRERQMWFCKNWCPSIRCLLLIVYISIFSLKFVSNRSHLIQHFTSHSSPCCKETHMSINGHWILMKMAKGQITAPLQTNLVPDTIFFCKLYFSIVLIGKLTQSIVKNLSILQ